MIVQACLNGARASSFHKRLPQRTVDIVADAIDVVKAGANELHVHIYGDVDRESLDPVDIDRTVGALRQALPGTLIGISSGAWIEHDDARRLACIAGWNQLPDHASVNLDEPGAFDVIAALHARGVGIEAGLSGAADAERLMASGLAPLVLRMLVEAGETDVTLAMAEADRTLAMLAGMPSPKPILLHGFDSTVWSFIERASRERFSIRVGFEDTNVLPDGSVAASNRALVESALKLRNRV